MSHSSVLALANETGAEFLQALRAPEFLVPTVLLPGIFYSMFGILLSKGGTAGYLLATYGVFAVTGPALFGFGVGVASEREKGWLELKRVMPASGLHYITAKLLTTLIFATFALLPIYALAGFVGDVAMTRMQWLTLASVHLLAVAPFSLVGLMLGFSFGSGGAVAVANIIFLGFALLGGLWFPIFLFPDFMRAIAQGLPSFHLAELALAIVDDRHERNAAWHLLVILVMTVVLFALAVWRWSRQK